jgi:hypothetical protein
MLEIPRTISQNRFFSSPKRLRIGKNYYFYNVIVLKLDKGEKISTVALLFIIQLEIFDDCLT